MSQNGSENGMSSLKYEKESRRLVSLDPLMSSISRDGDPVRVGTLGFALLCKYISFNGWKSLTDRSLYKA